MVKKYITVLPDGRKTQNAELLGRPITLVNGEIVTEGVLTQVYKSYFRPYKEEVKTEKPEVKTEPVKEEVVSEAVEVDDVLLPEENEAPKEHENHRNNKKRR